MATNHRTIVTEIQLQNKAKQQTTDDRHKSVHTKKKREIKPCRDGGDS